MVKLNRDAIVGRLEEHGLRHRTVTLQTEGEYLPTDVDWNNKDVPHLNYVHSQVSDVTCVIEKDLEASISLQKVLGIPFHLILVHYDTENERQTHFVTLLAWTMVTEHEFVQLTPTRTRAITSYTVASNRFWMLFWPILRQLLKRNYRKLMAEDGVLRERRGKLRSWGYTYRGDNDGPRDIRNSLVIAANNVLVSDPPPEVPTLAPVPLSSIGDGWTYRGRNDHLGLKLTRRGGEILAFGRMCPHEGADLDPVEVIDNCQVMCPWHGRKLSPLAVLQLDQPHASADTDWHHLEVSGDVVQITITGTGAPGEPTVKARRIRSATPTGG